MREERTGYEIPKRSVEELLRMGRDVEWHGLGRGTTVRMRTNPLQSNSYRKTVSMERIEG
jgi:hypothetical protein